MIEINIQGFKNNYYKYANEFKGRCTKWVKRWRISSE